MKIPESLNLITPTKKEAAGIQNAAKLNILQFQYREKACT